MQSPNKKKPLIVAIALILAVLIILAVVLIVKKSPSPPKSSTGGSHLDTLSHETVSNPSGVAPEKYGISPSAPVYLGFDKLLNYGLGLDQLNNLKLAFDKYSQSLPKPLTQVSVDVDSITNQHDATNPNSPFIIMFGVGFNGATTPNYQAKVEYTGLTDIRLYLLGIGSGQTIFDSQVIESQPTD